jgi:hypothetical protein
MKKTLLMLLGCIALTISCKKDKPTSDKLQVYFKPTQATGYYVLVTALVTNEKGKELLSLKDVKPSMNPAYSTSEVASGETITVDYKSSHNEISQVDFEVWWNGRLIRGSGNMDLNGKTGTTTTITIPNN